MIRRLSIFITVIAKACADHKIMIMYHGAFAPKGFNRTWPNAVGREGLLGSEYNMWSNRVTPGHDVMLAFTRMLAGGFDYEPGMFNNATQEWHKTCCRSCYQSRHTFPPALHVCCI